MADKKDGWLYEFQEIPGKADQKADELIEDGQTIIEKIKKSKWSALALVSGALAVVALLFK